MSSSTSTDHKVCCTCEYFGGTSKKCGSSIQFENQAHVCKIKARGNGLQGAMNGACNKWTPKQ